MLSFLTGLLLILASACHQTNDELPVTPSTSVLKDTLELLNSTLLAEDTSHYFVHSMFYNDKGVFFHYYQPFGPDTLKSVSSDDLKENWAFSYRNHSDKQTYCTNKCYYYSSLSNARHKLDLDTGQDQWQYLHSQTDLVMRNDFTIIGEYAYNSFNSEGRQVLARTNIHRDQIEWDEIFEGRDSSIDRARFAYPISWTNEEGDTILVSQQRIVRNTNQQSSDLFSYNLTKRQIMCISKT